VIQWWIFSDDFLVTLLAYIIVAISLNLEAGYTGIPNFGKHVFVYAGAFAAQGVGVRLAAWIFEKAAPLQAEAALNETARRIPWVEWHSVVQAAADPSANRIVMINYIKPFLHQHVGIEVALAVLVMLLAALIGMFFGLIASYAALRLREDYLAILLLAFAELMVMVLFYQNQSLSGGNQGLWAVTFTKKPLQFALIGSAILAGITFIYAERLGNSPMGRAMRAVRDDEIAASVFGRDIAMVRLKVILVASALAALAGFFTIEATPSAVSISYNRVVWTFLPWAMIILGGMANNKGAVLGAIVFLIGKRLFEYYQEQLAAALHISSGLVAGVLPNILIGVLILLVLYLRPQGILPEQPSKTVDFNRIVAEEGEEH
jgi:branched-chain amino acid transport system permease protein